MSSHYRKVLSADQDFSPQQRAPEKDHRRANPVHHRDCSHRNLYLAGRRLCAAVAGGVGVWADRSKINN